MASSSSDKISSSIHSSSIEKENNLKGHISNTAIKKTRNFSDKFKDIVY